jgi:hypothetical protein
MTPIEISIHPIDSNILREASFSGLVVDADPEFGFGVGLRIRIDHYFIKDEVKTAHPMPARWYTLRATKDQMVDAQGQLVDEGGIMSEFDFFIMLMGQPVVINQFVEAKIEWADNLGRFNV